MNPTIVRFAAQTLEELRAQYAAGGDPAEVLRELDRRIAQRGNDGVWLYRPPLEELLTSLPADRTLPLFGVPFAVKDNIDVAGWPTTAGCPKFAYTAARDAATVARLRAAGAIPIGKTNMDQFATGLVGTRSPHGIPRCVYDERYLAGGSSSGSAVAVAAGLATFALGTDTAGSGRVPAAFNNLVGLKPTRGLVSTRGVVPACRSLDCVSVFAHSVNDADAVLAVMAGEDAEDAYSRKAPAAATARAGSICFGLPQPNQLEFFGDDDAAALFAAAVKKMERLGHQWVEIDFAPFVEAARLLYAGPWVAERLAAIQPFLEQHAEAVDPTVRRIIAGGAGYTAVDTFRAQYELERLRKQAQQVWDDIDVLFLPTTGTIYKVNEVLDHPVELNSNLGRYTNFVNLLDLCALALPAGFRRANGLPFGITLMAPAFADARLSSLAREFLGEPSAPVMETGRIALAVVGAHLSGQPLHGQLSDRGARLLRTCRTAAPYQLYALAGTVPPKPGLVRRPDFAGQGLEVEVYSLTPEAFGDFVAHVPSPMVIGTVELEDGSTCKGFLCEPWALEGSADITSFGGWRAYLARQAPPGEVRLRARVMKKPAE